MGLFERKLYEKCEKWYVRVGLPETQGLCNILTQLSMIKSLFSYLCCCGCKCLHNIELISQKIYFMTAVSNFN